MKPTIVSVSITLVKDQFSEGMVMEIMALLSDGWLGQKTVPVDGRILRLDADFFGPMPAPCDEDGA